MGAFLIFIEKSMNIDRQRLLTYGIEATARSIGQNINEDFLLTPEQITELQEIRDRLLKVQQQFIGDNIVISSKKRWKGI